MRNQEFFIMPNDKKMCQGVYFQLHKIAKNRKYLNDPCMQDDRTHAC